MAVADSVEKMKMSSDNPTPSGAIFAGKQKGGKAELKRRAASYLPVE